MASPAEAEAQQWRTSQATLFIARASLTLQKSPYLPSDATSSLDLESLKMISTLEHVRA